DTDVCAVYSEPAVTLLCISGEAADCADCSATHDQILVQTPMNWSAAQSYCREKYTDLISINTEQDNIKITALMLSNIINTQTAWIGLYKTSWGWLDGSNATYTNWKSGEPKDGKDCALMETSSAFWSGEDCNKNHEFLSPPQTRERLVAG
uniref:C-type lectin domain-containing protein n=1 Tax=Maylandia zebra TaxID=106582 RepID=A0A3P9CKN4_9CICH